MVALLAEEGRHAASLDLEALWNRLQREHSFALLCACSMEHTGGESVTELFREIHAAHTRVIPAESYSALPTDDDRLREVALLQHKARWLEAEIAERRQVEERLRVALATEQAARREAESAVRQRDEFMRAAAHELKTPLTSLGARAQLMLRQIRRDGEIEQGRTIHAVEVISDQAGKLGRLVNQLLNVTRIEAGRLTIEPTAPAVAAPRPQTATSGPAAA
ncbi:MAG TPA: histidine kinase dimerization/phospho-acceptor domain-containing protein, partial [Thermomicrobiales bacterium]|nr:histidine kinase dimerization/phospho-acceptor domain-containing protein [Thermomicrobiales bacterium]